MWWQRGLGRRVSHSSAVAVRLTAHTSRDDNGVDAEILCSAVLPKGSPVWQRPRALPRLLVILDWCRRRALSTRLRSHCMSRGVGRRSGVHMSSLERGSYVWLPNRDQVSYSACGWQAVWSIPMMPLYVCIITGVRVQCRAAK
jgi:hypothetical protein